jgi:hypothetical protein
MALALTVVATLSTILTVPVQEATADDENREYEVDIEIEQENEADIEQENECKRTIASCVNLIEEISQNNQIGDNEEDTEEDTEE